MQHNLLHSSVWHFTCDLYILNNSRKYCHYYCDIYVNHIAQPWFSYSWTSQHFCLRFLFSGKQQQLIMFFFSCPGFRFNIWLIFNSTDVMSTSPPESFISVGHTLFILAAYSTDTFDKVTYQGLCGLMQIACVCYLTRKCVCITNLLYVVMLVHQLFIHNSFPGCTRQ